MYDVLPGWCSLNALMYDVLPGWRSLDTLMYDVLPGGPLVPLCAIVYDLSVRRSVPTFDTLLVSDIGP